MLTKENKTRYILQWVNKSDENVYLIECCANSRVLIYDPISQEIYELLRYLIFQNEDLKIKKAKVLANKDYIYLFHPNNIEIGKIDNELIFNPKYIFKYNSKEIYQIEKKNISKYEIVHYIESRSCNIRKNDLQELIKNYNEKIGYLVILKDINNNIRRKSSFINLKKQESKTEDPSKKRGKTTKKTKKEKGANNIIDNFNTNMQIINHNNENPKNIKLNKNNNLNIGNPNNIYDHNNMYENIINNLKPRNNQFNININPNENIFNEEALNKLNDNYLHNKPFSQEYKKEDLNNFEEEINNGQIENKDEKYENIIKKNISENKIKEENIFLKKEELNNYEESVNNNQIENKEETYENIEKEIIYQNKVKEENLKREELIKENEKLKLIKKINEKKLKDIKDKIEEYKSLYNKLNEVNEENEENEFIKKNIEAKICSSKEKENALKTNIEYYIQEKERIKKENEIIKQKNEEKKSQIINKKKKYNEIIEEIEKSTKIIAQLKKDKELKRNNTSDKIKKYNRNDGNQIIDDNEKDQEINEVLKNKPIILYDSPTLIGLNNIGATCFMNATLQCLSQTEGLTNFFLNKKNYNKIINNNIALNNKNDLQLCPYYLQLILKLWDKNNAKSSFSPNNFRNIVEQLNPLFKAGQAGDSKDFIIFILEQIHKELKAPINKVLNNQNNSNFLNQYDRNISFNYFVNEFSKECSVISDLFFGVNETTNICLNCKNYCNLNGLLNYPICYNYGIFNCLIFPLEEVKNMRNKNSMQINNFFQMTNEVSLLDCFFYNQKSEVFTGENRNYCNICRQLYDSIYTSKIFISPNVLILILNRGRGNIYNVKLNFTEKIDITQFVVQKDKPKILYELYGVITHIGQSGPNAHFVASCKSPVDFQWYRYNDAFVNPITNLQKEVIEFGCPYILFYQKL